MQDYQLRVIDEREELNIKIDKLNKFIKLDIFKKCQIDEQNRLKKQLNIMQEYSQILAERITHFD